MVQKLVSNIEHEAKQHQRLCSPMYVDVMALYDRAAVIFQLLK